MSKNFTKVTIQALLTKLSGRLVALGVIGEIGVVGGAAMVLAYNARVATRDVDAIFEPSTIIRQAAEQIAAEEGLPKDWLNDAVKGFMPGLPRNKAVLFDLPGLRVWTPEPEYMLAMKAFSARVDTQDGDDMRTLIELLKLRSAPAVFEIVQRYYPQHPIPAKTQFFVEELFDSPGR